MATPLRRGRPAHPAKLANRTPHATGIRAHAPARQTPQRAVLRPGRRPARAKRHRSSLKQRPAARERLDRARQTRDARYLGDRPSSRPGCGCHCIGRPRRGGSPTKRANRTRDAGGTDRARGQRSRRPRRWISSPPRSPGRSSRYRCEPGRWSSPATSPSNAGPSYESRADSVVYCQVHAQCAAGMSPIGMFRVSGLLVTKLRDERRRRRARHVGGAEAISPAAGQRGTLQLSFGLLGAGLGAGHVCSSAYSTTCLLSADFRHARASGNAASPMRERNADRAASSCGTRDT